MKENQNTSRSKLHTDFCTNTRTFQALREEKKYAVSTMENTSDQSFNSSFDDRKSLSMIQERDTETDTEMASNRNPYLGLEMSIETKLLPRNLFDDTDADLISLSSSLVEPTSVAKLKSESSSYGFNSIPNHCSSQSVLGSVKNRIIDLLVTNKVSSNSDDNSQSIEWMVADSLVNKIKSHTEIKSYKYNNITFKECEIKGRPCNEVEIRMSPIRTEEIPTRDPRNQEPREPIREVKMKRSSELSNDNPLYKTKATTEITKGKYIEELYRAHYSSNTHPSIEELYKAKCSSNDKRLKIKSKIMKSK